MLGSLQAFCRAENRALTISNVSLDKKTFAPEKAASVKIRYTLSADAAVSVRLYDADDVLVRTLMQNTPVTAGSHSAEWDGKNDNGEPLPPGAYIYTLEAKKSHGDSAVYDPADDSGGILLKVKKSFLDTKKGEISYVMPKAGMVRIRAGIKDGPLLKTVIDWQPREAGRNIEKWDGKDKSGLIDVFGILEKEIYIFAYSLPDNSIILSSPASSLPGVSRNPGRDRSGVRNKRPARKIDPQSKYKHALHDKSICHEPEFRVIFPPDIEKTPDGTPVVTGVVPVKIVIAERDRRHLESERFEVMFFVDTRFIFEDEEGFTPFTYMWNTEDLSEGEHVFTVNIWSYDDHCGVEGRNVLIRR